MNEIKNIQKPAGTYLTVAAVVPKLKIGDVVYNTEQLIAAMVQADEKQAQIMLFPELSLTGYTLEDMFQQNLLGSQVDIGINKLLKASKLSDNIMIVGAPLTWRGKLYNCAVIISKGEICGVVPKSYLPNYSEFYEKRWFVSGKDIINRQIEVNNKTVPFGTDLIFSAGDIRFGVEICEDVWAPIPPSTKLILAGADVIFNLSASNELVGKSVFRRQMIAAYSAKLACGYVYVSSGVTESTADIVMGGDALVAETGRIITNGKKFSRQTELTLADIDIEHIRHDRRQNMTIENNLDEARLVKCNLRKSGSSGLNRKVDPFPFIPKDSAKMTEVIDEIFNIQANGLATRMENSGKEKLLIGLSGGLDSTLAALVAVRALKLLGLSTKSLYAITMPGSASSNRTQTNAKKLAEALGVTYEQKSIIGLTNVMLETLGHKGQQDLAYENTQARARTSILLNRANQIGGLVVGTGDLSEIALGWCTFNGDHISHYNVNASIPKTLVKHIVSWISDQPDFSRAKDVLKDIIDTPISPELVSQKDGMISQKTEDIIGPYVLHDFFLYYFRRWGDSQEKIQYLATQAFDGTYSEAEIEKWLEVFMSRFYANQWKRNVMPDGPKVGTVSLSPRGDLRMAPDTKRPNKAAKDL